MKSIVTLIALAALFVAPSALAEDSETPATPIERVSPEYPEGCLQENDDSPEEQSVVVVFDISREGTTENVRVFESENSCFHEAAVAAVRKWIYEPRTIGGEPVPQKEIKTVLTFSSGESHRQEVAAMLQQEMLRIYPERCQENAKATEYVIVQYDISKAGDTQNVTVIESTNSCFDKTAVQFVDGWQYEQSDAERKDVEVTLTFQLE